MGFFFLVPLFWELIWASFHSLPYFKPTRGSTHLLPFRSGSSLSFRSVIPLPLDLCLVSSSCHCHCGGVCIWYVLVSLLRTPCGMPLLCLPGSCICSLEDITGTGTSPAQSEYLHFWALTLSGSSFLYRHRHGDVILLFDSIPARALRPILANDGNAPKHGGTGGDDRVAARPPR